MDLSGHFIKGTGSYEVKEIAPPSVKGNMNDGTWVLGTDWISSDQLILVASNSSGTTSQNVGTVTGKTYRIRGNVVGFTGGSCLILPINSFIT